MCNIDVLASILLWGVAVTFAGCGGDIASSNPDKPKVGFMHPCATSDDCLAGLTCADKGDIAGLCSKPCSKVDECATTVGDPESYCQIADVFFCARNCREPSDCPTNHC